MRTREEQITDLGSRIFVGMRNHTDSMCEAQRHIDEAEARGAEEQRRKDGEGQEPIGWLVNQKGVDAPFFTKNIHATKSQFITGLTHLYSQPANVAALEAEIASLKEAEQLARADAEASKARVEMLEGQITALNTPQYYAVEGDDFAQNSIADIFDDCDAEHNTIIQVNGYRQVSSEWALFDGESLHVFPTENEAEAAHTALTREGGV